NYSQTAHEFLAKMIEFDLKGRAAKGKDPRCHIDELAVGKLFDEGLVARLLRQFGDPVHRPLEIPDLPVGGAGSTVENLSRAIGIDVELKDRRALGTQSPLVVRAAGVAFDIGDLPVDGVDQGATPHRAIGTDAGRHLGVFDSELLGLGY